MAAHLRTAAPRVGNTVFLLCDIQEKFRPLIHEFATVVQAAKTLTRSAQALGCPVVATEQYPKALGPTATELQPYLRSESNPRGALVLAKTKFSMMTPELDGALEAAFPVTHLPELRSQPDFGASWKDAAPVTGFGLRHAVLYGIEAHVCIQQTALELLARGVQVHLVVDGVSSQRRGDRAIALANLAAAGASLTTTEAIVFQLMGDAKHPAFKQVQPLVIEHAAAFKGEAGLKPLDYMA